MKPRRILVTCALPYANGALHLGSLVGYIQTDIWTRFQKLQGHECYYVCGSDAHGTPIMIKAQNQHKKPEELVREIRDTHQADFSDFLVNFDNFHTTHSEENRQLAELIYTRLKNKGMIIEKEISQAYDPLKNIFLPDRFVKGNCPKCHADDQYGDSCEVCGATYSPLDLENPRSILSGQTPISKNSHHYFFDLPQFTTMLKAWTHGGHLQEQVVNKLDEWFEQGLIAWDITRDAPYFGFLIPGEKDKYFYVWLDAPIGYLASFKHYCQNHPNINFDDFFAKNSDTELYHFIGKDITYFHALFWPAILKGADFRTPTGVFVHGFLTVNGQKMSKSRGTFVTARTYLNHLQPEYFRYYLATKLNNRVDDLDLNLSDFVQRINSDLVGKYVNIASRSARFIEQYFDNRLASELADKNLFAEFVQAGDHIAECYEQREYSAAIRSIMALADKANQYVDQNKPWIAAKEETSRKQLQLIATQSLNLFRLLTLYLKPVLPQLTHQVENFLNCPPLTWENRSHPLCDHTINRFTPLLQRIDQKQVDHMIDASKETTPPVSAASHLSKDPIKPEISIDDFAKIDLRIAKIIKAEAVEGADKLLQLTLDLGGEERQVFAGIKSAFAPEDLIGKLTVMVANLAPRKMRFGVSSGMVLAAGPGGSDLFILHPGEGAEPGMRVK